MTCGICVYYCHPQLHLTNLGLQSKSFLSISIFIALDIMSKRFCCTNCGKSFLKPVGLHKHLVSSQTTTHCIQYYMAASKLGSKAIQTFPLKEGQKLYLTRQQMKDIVQGLLLTEHDVTPKDVLIDNVAAAPDADDDDVSVLAYVDLDNPSEPEDSPNLEHNSINTKEPEEDTSNTSEPLTGTAVASTNPNMAVSGMHLMTNSQKHEIRLLQLLQNLNAPNYAYTQIIQWARTAFLSGYDFCPKHKDYNGQIHYLERWLHSSQHLRPH